MGKKWVRPSAEFKAKVALEGLKGLKTVNALANQYQVPPTQIRQLLRQYFTKAIPMNKVSMEVVTAAVEPMLGFSNSLGGVHEADSSKPSISTQWCTYGLTSLFNRTVVLKHIRMKGVE